MIYDTREVLLQETIEAVTKAMRNIEMLDAPPIGRYDRRVLSWVHKDIYGAYDKLMELRERTAHQEVTL